MDRDVPPDPLAGERFERLYDAWSQSVRDAPVAYSSSDRDYIHNPYFEAIVELGEDALPFIMEKLRSDEGAHFLIHALARITGQRLPPGEAGAEEPVGNQAIARLWISWWDSRHEGKEGH